MTLKETIFSCDDLPTETLYIPEWDVEVGVRTMTGAERDRYEAEFLQNKDKDLVTKLRNMRAKLVVLCTVDAEGNRVFEDEDVERVGQKSAAALDRIFNVAQRLNAVSDDDVEEIAKN